MNGMPLILLVFFSAFTMNPVLQCALGINNVEGKSRRLSTLIRLGIIFFAIIILWVFFSVIISSIISGIYIYVLLFPLSYLVYNAMESLIFTYALKKDPTNECSIGFPGGITAAAVFICINIANNFMEAVSLSFGFAAGTFLVFVILDEISRRAALEAVPRFLRGKPLILISMGMLSLIFSTASLLLFGMLEAR